MRTTGVYILNNPNGFVALGILKEPTDHIDKKVNTMWLWGVGIGRTEDEILPFIDNVLTIDEVKGFIKVFTEGLKVAEKHGVKRTNKKG